MPHTPDGTEYVLILSCPDRPGIVHAVSGFLVERGANIVESQQFGDRLTHRFFMRIGFATSRENISGSGSPAIFSSMPAARFGFMLQ